MGTPLLRIGASPTPSASHNTTAPGHNRDGGEFEVPRLRVRRPRTPNACATTFGSPHCNTPLPGHHSPYRRVGSPVRKDSLPREPPKRRQLLCGSVNGHIPLTTGQLPQKKKKGSVTSHSWPPPSARLRQRMVCTDHGNVGAPPIV